MARNFDQTRERNHPIQNKKVKMDGNGLNLTKLWNRKK